MLLGCAQSEILVKGTNKLAARLNAEGGHVNRRTESEESYSGTTRLMLGWAGLCAERADKRAGDVK